MKIYDIDLLHHVAGADVFHVPSILVDAASWLMFVAWVELQPVLYGYGCLWVTVEMVENHCRYFNIAEAILSDVHETLLSDRSPPQAIMAQNTGKWYGTPKSDNQ